MHNDRIRYWKDRFRDCFLAGDAKGMAEAEANLERWTQFEANEAGALKELEESGRQQAK